MNYGLNAWEFTLYIAFPLLAIGLSFWIYLFIYWFKGNDLDKIIGEGNNLIGVLWAVIIGAWLLPFVGLILIPALLLVMLMWRGFFWMLDKRNENYDRKHGIEQDETELIQRL